MRIEYKVNWKDGVERKTEIHNSFASAAGQCAGLDQKCYISANIKYDDGSSHFGFLFRYLNHGSRYVMNPAFHSLVCKLEKNKKNN